MGICQSRGKEYKADIGYNESIIDFENRVWKEKLNDTISDICKKIGIPLYIMTDIKAYKARCKREEDFLNEKKSHGFNQDKVYKIYCWSKITIFTYKFILLPEHLGKEVIWKVIYVKSPKEEGSDI